MGAQDVGQCDPLDAVLEPERRREHLGENGGLTERDTKLQRAVARQPRLPVHPDRHQPVNLLSQLIFLTDPDMYTVPVALRTFVDSTADSSWGSPFANSIVSLVPIFVIFLFGQRYLVRGIATTGIK